MDGRENMTYLTRWPGLGRELCSRAGLIGRALLGWLAGGARGRRDIGAHGPKCRPVDLTARTNVELRQQVFPSPVSVACGTSRWLDMVVLVEHLGNVGLLF